MSNATQLISQTGATQLVPPINAIVLKSGLTPVGVGGGAVTSVAGRTGAVTLTSADLTDTTPAGRALLDDADAAAQRATLGLGTAATTAASAYAPASHAASHQSGGSDPLSGLVSAQMPKWSQGTAISATTHNAASADAGLQRAATGASLTVTFDNANIAPGDFGSYRSDAGGPVITWAGGGTIVVVPLESGHASTQAAPAVLCWLCVSATLVYVWGQTE